jgi:hypothetical protein
MNAVKQNGHEAVGGRIAGAGGIEGGDAPIGQRDGKGGASGSGLGAGGGVSAVLQRIDKMQMQISRLALRLADGGTAAFNASGFAANSARGTSANSSSESTGFGPFARGDGDFFTLASVQAQIFTSLRAHRVRMPSPFSLTKASDLSSNIANSAPVSRGSKTSRLTCMNRSTTQPQQNSSTALRSFTALQSAFASCLVAQT